MHQNHPHVLTGDFGQMAKLGKLGKSQVAAIEK
jgi:hypothetical protein